MVTGLAIAFNHHRILRTGIAAVATGILVHGIATALTRDFPEASLIRGRTASGYPYLNGGINFDEQRLIQRAARRYNLELILVSTPVTPVVGERE